MLSFFLCCRELSCLGAFSAFLAEWNYEWENLYDLNLRKSANYHEQRENAGWSQLLVLHSNWICLAYQFICLPVIFYPCCLIKYHLTSLNCPILFYTVQYTVVYCTLHSSAPFSFHPYCFRNTEQEKGRSPHPIQASHIAVLFSSAPEPLCCATNWSTNCWLVCATWLNAISESILKRAVLSFFCDRGRPPWVCSPAMTPTSYPCPKTGSATCLLKEENTTSTPSVMVSAV